MSNWLVLGIVAAAVGAISAHRLIGRVFWLAATSVLLALLLAMIGAPLVAVVEVSVGAGLVAVLFVFTIGIAGDDVPERPLLPVPLALLLTTSATLLLLWLVLPFGSLPTSIDQDVTMRRLADALWQDRAADLLGQAVLIVVAALAVRTILGSSRAASKPAARPPGDGHAPRTGDATTTQAVAAATMPATGAAAELADVAAPRAGVAAVREEVRA